MIDTKQFFNQTRRISKPNFLERVHRETFYLQAFQKKYDIVSTNDIFQMINKIYDNPEEMNYIAQQYGIEFKFTSLQEGELVGGAYYSSTDKKIHIEISVNIYIKIMKGEDKQKLKDIIAISFVHENIHKQQDQGLNSTEGRKNYNNGNNLSTWKDIVSYMSQKDEVDAYASEVTLDLVNHNMTISKFLSTYLWITPKMISGGL